MATDIGRLVATLGLNTSPFMAGMKQSQSAMQKLATSSMVVGRAMTRFVTLPMVLAGGAAIKTQKNFEASMTKIIGLVGVSRDQVEKWNKQVLQMSRATGKGPEALADALYFVTSAGIRGAEAMEVLEMAAKASAAGLGETKVVADLVTSAMNAYGKENLSAAQATDILVASVREGKAEADELAGAMGMVLPIASSFGVTFDQVGAAFAGMTRTGTNARVAATQLKAILSAMASPSGEASKAMAQYGINAETFRKTVREDGLITALLDLKDSVNGNEAALSEIFPNIRALMGTLDLLGANVEYNVKIFDALKNSSGSLARAFEEIGGTTQQKLNVAMATLKSTFVSIGEALKPLVTKVLTALSDKLTQISSRMEVMSDSSKRAKITLNILTAAIGPLMLVLAKLSQSIVANPWFALATAIGFAALALGKWVVNRSTANKVENDAIRQRKEITAGIAKEIVATNNLFTALKTAKKGTEEWEAIRVKINSKYGQYLENMITEKDTLEDIERAQKRVTGAKLADLSVQAYGKESARLIEEYQNTYTKKMGGFINYVTENRAKLYDATGNSLADFIQELNQAMQEDIAAVGDADFDFMDAALSKKYEEIYKKYLAPIGGEMTLKYSEQAFKNVYAQTTKLTQEFDKQIAIADTKVAEFQKILEDQFGMGDDVDNSAKLKSLNEQIKYTESVADSMGKQETLLTLISLHEQKNLLLKGDEQAANEAILKNLREQYAMYRKTQSSLGIEARLQGEIEQLQKNRKLLTKADLEANSKAINNAEIALALLQNETSGLSNIEKLRGNIVIAQERAKDLDGEALRDQNDFIRGLERTVNILDLYADGANDIVIMQARLNDLEEDATRLKGKAADSNYQDQINLRNRIAYQQALVGGLGEEEAINLDIDEIQQKLVDSSGENRDALLDQLSVLYRIRDTMNNIDPPGWEMDTMLKVGTDAWTKFYKERIRLAKEAEKNGEMTEYARLRLEYDTNKKILAARMANIDAALQAASNFISAKQSLFEVQMAEELKAAGDNLSRQEQIKKKYYEKEKNWALAMAAINIALGITKALAAEGLAGVIEGIGIAAAGGVQIAAIEAEKFAKGGLVYGDTLAQVGEYPGASSNPEVIAPLSQLKKMLFDSGEGKMGRVEFMIDGRVLKGVLKQQELYEGTY